AKRGIVRFVPQSDEERQVPVAPRLAVATLQQTVTSILAYGLQQPVTACGFVEYREASRDERRQQIRDFWLGDKASPAADRFTFDFGGRDGRDRSDFRDLFDLFGGFKPFAAVAAFLGDSLNHLAANRACPFVRDHVELGRYLSR